MPRSFRPGVQKALRATFFPAVFVTGVLVGLCTVPCTGGIYLGVLALLSAQGSAANGLGLLILYNVMFVLPLVAILALVTSRATYRGVARWHLRTKSLVKVVLGVVMLVLGLATLLVLT
jgi:cytochrome c biogenesis protein CcdA